jgi:cytoskeletal protein CcmA (bactofilin family)
MVLMVTVIAAGGALAVDVGTAYVFRERSEFVMEAAALAAAPHLPNASAALSTARSIAQLNGLDPAKVQVLTPWNGDSAKLQVSYGDDRPTYLARTLGISLLRINTRAVAKRGSPAVFDYAIFSGSTFELLDFSGMTLTVNGSVHANENIRIRGARVTVSGALEAAGVVDVRGSDCTAGAMVNYAPVIPMPVYNNAELRDMCSIRFSGAQHWSGITVNINGNVFVDGDLKLSGVTITGKGMLMVTGNIELAGTSLRYANPSADGLALYGQKDIKVTGTNFTADGILYAPNGKIYSHGSSLTVNGSIVGNIVDFSGINATVNHNGSASAAFPANASSLTR